MTGISQFDGDAAFSGGGFVPAQTTQTPETGMTPARNRDAQTLQPFTVKQMNEAFEASDGRADLQIDGVDVINVKIVGMLVEKIERGTDVSFVVDDGTGCITCLRWVNDPVDKQELECLPEGTYVKVHGHLKLFQGKKQFVVYAIRPVVDYNEIAHHFAECIYVHCYNTKVRKVQVADQVRGHMANSAINTPSKSYLSGPSNHVSVQYDTGGGRDLTDLVFSYFQHPSCINSEKGINLHDLAQQLKVPLQSVVESMQPLIGEGLVYSTIDEYHYKSTTNG